jgi:Fe-S-cluster containining protein
VNNTAKLAALEALYAMLPKIECQRKCQDYCGPIMMTRLEAKRLPELICDKVPLKFGVGFHTRTPSKTLICPLLKEGACSVYSRRPAICRLWGLTDELRCPFGCEPDERWDDVRAKAWLDAVRRIGL